MATPHPLVLAEKAHPSWGGRAPHGYAFVPGYTFVTPGEVLVELADTGVGVAPDQLPHVFDRFYRAVPSVGEATARGSASPSSSGSSR